MLRRLGLQFSRRGLGLALASVLLGIMLVSTFMPKEQSNSITRPHPLLGWENVPGVRGTIRQPQFTTTIQINALGLRNDMPTVGDSSRRTRIAVLGDTIAFGLGSELTDRFDTLLGDRLHDTDWANFAVPGYGPDQEYLLLRERVAHYHPDVVLWVLSAANDEWDLLLNEKYGLAKPRFSLQDGRLQLLPPAQSKSHWIKNLTGNLSLQRLLGRPEPPATIQSVQRQRLHDLELVLPFFARDPSPQVLEARKVQAALFREARRWGEEHNAIVGIVLVPLGGQTPASRWEEQLSMLNVDPGSFSRTMSQTATKAAADEAGIPTLDLLPLMDGLSSEEEPYLLPYTGYLTARGHRKAAEALAPWLCGVLAKGAIACP